MYNLNVWRTTLGKTDTFGGWRNGDTVWHTPIRQMPLNSITCKSTSEDQMEELSTGDYKNNFIVIEIGVPNAKPGPLFFDENGNEHRELELNQHIVDDIWGADDPDKATHLWKLRSATGLYNYNIPLKPKNEIKEHLITIFGEMVFNAVNDGKVKLLINSSSEMSGKPLLEFILYVLEYVGIKKEYVSVMLNNGVNVDNPKVISWDYFLIESQFDLKYIYQMVYSSFPFDEEYLKYLSEYKKPKRYLCYNANLHGHRLFILGWLFGKKLEEFGLISALNRQEDNLKEHFNQIENMFFDNEFSFSTENTKELVRESDHPLNFILTTLPILFEKLPLILDIDNNYLLKENNALTQKFMEVYGEDVNIPHMMADNQYRTDRYIHTQHFTDTYFSLVTETTWEHFGWGVDNLVRVTEKIYKAVALHPFIVMGNKNTLKYLRSIGFETFPEMFDESYDEIEDPVDRAVFIMKEVERLCSMDIEELHKIYISVLPKIKHNQEVFMSIDADKIFCELLDESLNA